MNGEVKITKRGEGWCEIIEVYVEERENEDAVYQ